MTPKYMHEDNDKDRAEERGGGRGVRFWNFLDRATIGPSRDVTVGRHTGARI